MKEDHKKYIEGEEQDMSSQQRIWLSVRSIVEKLNLKPSFIGEYAHLEGEQKLWLLLRLLFRGFFPMLLYLFFPALSMSIGYLIVHPDMKMQEFLTYGGNFYTVVGAALTLFVLYRMEKKRGKNLFKEIEFHGKGLSLKKVLMIFFFGFSAAVCISAVLTLLPRMGMLESYTDNSMRMFRGKDVALSVVTMVFLAPLLEEIIFRGYMLSVFFEALEEKRAILICTLIFAICHIHPLWILYAFAFGYVLSYLAIREENVVYSVIAHMGFNMSAAVNWLIEANPKLDTLFYRSKGLILIYGLIFCLIAVLLARLYLTGSLRRSKG